MLNALTIILAAATSFPGLAKEGDLKVRGSTLHYVVQGNGPACLMIGSSLYYPRTFSQNLRKHLRLIFVDLPWFAPKYTPVELSSYTLDSVVADVESIRQQLNLNKPILMGHSIHGTIALEYARRHSEHVSRLVMIGSPVLMTSDRYEASASAIWKTASAVRQKLQNQNWSHLPDFKKNPQLQPDVENYVAMAPKYWFNPRYDARWIWAGMTIHPDLLHHLFEDIFRNYDMFGKSRTVPVPSYVATGRFDYVIPHTSWVANRKISNLTVSLFERSGHTPQLEEPNLFDERLLAWLSQPHTVNPKMGKQ
jgi:proline iminopeptidase